MNPAVPSHLQSLAPDFARSLRALLENLRAVIAAHWRIPLLYPLVIPLSNVITRVARRMERRLARLAAGRPPWRRAAATPRAAVPRRQPVRLFPHRFGWLTHLIGYRVAACGSQIEALLAQPAVAELLAFDPGLARILLPIRRMLGDMPRRPRKPRAPRPKPAAPPEPVVPPAPIRGRTPKDWRPTIENPVCPDKRPWWYPIERERLVSAIARLRPAPADS